MKENVFYKVLNVIGSVVDWDCSVALSLLEGFMTRIVYRAGL